MRVVGLKAVQAKVTLAAPRILAQNRVLATSMLEFIKDEVRPQMPLGPAHFGIHARDSYKIEVESEGVKTTGKLWAAVEAYWREFGTLGRFKKGSYRRPTVANAKAALYAVTVGSGGEPPRPITQHALAGARKFIKFYYGSGKAYWWGV